MRTRNPKLRLVDDDPKIAQIFETNEENAGGDAAGKQLKLL